jgi:hypothetical protein
VELSKAVPSRIIAYVHKRETTMSEIANCPKCSDAENFRCSSPTRLVLLGHKTWPETDRRTLKGVGRSFGAIQPVEDVYGLIWTAVEQRCPLSAVYNHRRRLFCPHRLGRNKQGQLRVLRYQYGGESESGLRPVGSPANWRCIAVEKLSAVKLLESSWRTAPNHSRPASCIADADIDAEDYPGPDPQKGH